MGRKSLAVQRKEQILDAFERCVVRNGLDGVTIEQIANEADVMPSIIRHYIGNWNDLVRELVHRTIRRYDMMIDELSKASKGHDVVPRMLENMYPVTSEAADREKFVLGLLMTAKDRYPETKEMILDLLRKATTSMGEALHRTYPNTPKETCDQVAYSLICISITNDIAKNMGMDLRYTEGARVSAEALINFLETMNRARDDRL
ncbi:MAG: TetR/AcrR family transcriptional regulator [Methanomassiliicoccales archaeon]|nr:MAG: TetR/AcrR family transcriptional regulator [Methanomassiliicoccales archaeon]